MIMRWERVLCREKWHAFALSRSLHARSLLIPPAEHPIVASCIYLQVTLLGESMGGILALRICLAAADLVKQVRDAAGGMHVFSLCCWRNACL